MTLQAAIEAELPFLRAEAEARMLTTVAIQYASGAPTQDPNTGTETPTYETAFTTKARLSIGRGLAVRAAEVGGRTAAEVVRILSIPVDSADPWADDRAATGVSALVTAIDAATDDPTMLGVRLTLSGPAPGSQTTARRYEVEEVVA